MDNNKLINTQKEFVSVAKEMFGENTTKVSRKEVVRMINDRSIKYPVWLLKSPTYRIGRGQYNLPTFESAVVDEGIGKDTMSTETESVVDETVINDTE